MSTPVQGFSIVRKAIWTSSREYMAKMDRDFPCLVYLEHQAMLADQYVSGGSILQAWPMESILNDAKHLLKT